MNHKDIPSWLEWALIIAFVVVVIAALLWIGPQIAPPMRIPVQDIPT